MLRPEKPNRWAYPRETAKSRGRASPSDLLAASVWEMLPAERELIPRPMAPCRGRFSAKAAASWITPSEEGAWLRTAEPGADRERAAGFQKRAAASSAAAA